MKWEKKKLISICELNYGRNLPAASRIEGDFPVYGSAGKVGTHTTFLTEGPGIIIGRKGSIGKVYYEKENFFPIDTVYYITNSDNYEIRFLYYALQTLGLDKLNSDAAVPGLNRNVAYEQEISLPPLATQRRIASILSAYDDLIENNLRRIKLLEEAARREYKMLNCEGSEQVDFRDLVKWVKGKKPKDISQVRLDGYLPYLVFDTIEGNAITYANTEKVPLATTDDVLMCMDGARSGVVFRGMEGVLGSTFASLKLNQPELSEYVYQFLCNNLEYIVQGNVGAAIPHANKDYINSMKISIPDDTQLVEYNIRTGQMVKLIRNLKSQNSELRQARDLLLPKVMSGEIDVEEISGATYFEDESFEGSMAAEDVVAYQ